MPVVVVGEFNREGRIVGVRRFESTWEACKHYRDRIESEGWDGYWKDLEYVG